MTRPLHRSRQAWLASALIGASMCVTHAVAADAKDSNGLSFESTPVLTAGRVPVPRLMIALSRLPSDQNKRKDLLTALGGTIDQLPDASVQLGWVAPSSCEAPDQAGESCSSGATPQTLDAATRAAFKAFLAAAGRQTGASESSDAPTTTARTIAYAEEQSSLAAAHQPQKGADLLCRQSHVVLVGTDVGPGTLRPDQPHDGAMAPKPVIHQVAAAGDGLAAQIDEAVQTAVAESQGPDDTRTLALAMVPNAKGGEQAVVAARYNAHGWHGELALRTLQRAGIDTSSAPWGRQAGSGEPHTTATLLDAREPDTRVILSSQGEGQQLKGLAWRWTELPQAQRALLERDAHQRPDGLGSQRLEWLRGVRADEQANGGKLRDRRSPQADMLGSVPWASPGRLATRTTPAQPTMIYAAGNGGMLHAFDAESGQERFAYVPQGALAKVAAMSQPQYLHQASIAASPFTADWQEGDQTRRWLFGTPGAGGKGYFALDVSNLQGFADESQGAQQIRLDTTASEDPDLGHIFGTPVTAAGDPWRSASVMRLNDGRTALVLGNGFGSESGRAVLLLHYLDGARELRKIPAGKEVGNGLGPVRLVDLDGDRKADLAYAGDLRGYVWKFDLRATDPAQWRVAVKSQPMFMAKDEQAHPQPITSAPTTWPHPERGRILVFGTGRMLTPDDRGDTSTQTIYGIHDRDDDEPASRGRAALRRRELVSGASRVTTAAASDSAAGSAPGWYVDLPVPGERVLDHPRHFDGQLIDIVSSVPAPVPPVGAGESCKTANERQFRNTLRALDGEPPRTAIHGTSDAPLTVGRLELSATPSVAVRSLSREVRMNFEGGQDDATRARLGFIAVRPSWRQLQ
ncbi:PilC/PilY family type IV pilus protein [Variovorax dokdonensis]|uniref:PilC/PilY family type IV pilus protein n=1 Tax=Variovorax dokdonensis TaxID=344883 RepID=A0ABT7NCY8_9BURK|nr:PilC/PilY family type IV pilus protein [Variovorax dokdonensis]MDM0045825.1 PilC/PilY family type IV pilus protein [Variovorax dokdonensis]